jgi:hypothetical protein
MVTRRTLVGRFNLGDRVYRSNLPSSPSPSPRPSAVAGSAPRRRSAPGRYFADQVCAPETEPIPQTALSARLHEASLIWENDLD